MSHECVKNMLLTGATGGVGCDLLSLASRAGWNVVGIYHRNEEQAEAIQKAWSGAPGSLQMMACDLTNQNDVNSLLGRLPEDYCPDVLVHLAARPLDVNPLLRVTWDDCQQQLDASVKPVVLLTPPLVKRMIRRGTGRVVAALSTVVLGTPPRGFSSYTLAKYSLLGYMNCLAAECAERGISVNTVSPGPMNTKMLRNLPTLLTDQIRASTPSGNWIDTDSVARAIFWLAGDAPSELTGCNLPLTSATAE
jgi:NAD(P)-dependent dehydrogenase (short-subunit alcohol dehydrogenase family)